MRKILIIRFSSIGDIVLTSPIIRCLKKQLPDAEIHFLTKPSFASLVKNNPYVHCVHLWQKDTASLFKALRAEQFDEVIDLHHNLRSLRVKLQLKVPAHSFAKLNWEKFLLVQFKMNHMPNVHIVDRYFQTVAHLGVKNDGLGLDFFIPSSVQVRWEDLPERHRKGFIGIVIGASYFTKRLPEANIAAAIAALQQPVILLGGKEDHAAGENIIQMLSIENKALVFNACGQFSLEGSARLIEMADRVLTNDTGMMHIAAALDKKTVTVWGNTVPELGMTPYYSSLSNNSVVVLENKNLKCRPCSKIGYKKCPKGHFNCMRSLSGSMIAQQLTHE